MANARMLKCEINKTVNDCRADLYNITFLQMKFRKINYLIEYFVLWLDLDSNWLID